MNNMKFEHTPVLYRETIENLNIKPDGIYADLTLGKGGHSKMILEKLSDKGLLIGIDQDTAAIKAASENLKDYDNKVFFNTNFENIGKVLTEAGFNKIDGALMDIGVSSYQLDTPERGFSYMHDGPLDMRMDKRQKLDAAYVVNHYKEEALADVIYRYGEERWSKRIAQFIVAARQEKQLVTTGELVDVIKKAIPKGARRNGPHPAKRTFQALRIEVNSELSILADVVTRAVDRLAIGGRIGVITFHSLEDRIVKQTLAQLAKGCTCPPQLPICICGKKPQLKKTISIKPTEQEIKENPRSRSARLRGAIKI